MQTEINNPTPIQIGYRDNTTLSFKFEDDDGATIAAGTAKNYSLIVTILGDCSKQPQDHCDAMVQQCNWTEGNETDPAGCVDKYPDVRLLKGLLLFNVGDLETCYALTTKEICDNKDGEYTLLLKGSAELIQAALDSLLVIGTGSGYPFMLVRLIDGLHSVDNVNLPLDDPSNARSCNGEDFPVEQRCRSADYIVPFNVSAIPDLDLTAEKAVPVWAQWTIAAGCVLCGFLCCSYCIVRYYSSFECIKSWQAARDKVRDPDGGGDTGGYAPHAGAQQAQGNVNQTGYDIKL